MQNGSSAPRATRPRPEGGAANRMFASIQSTLRSGAGRDFKSDSAPALRNERKPRRSEYTPVVLKSVDEVIGQLNDLERRGEHSTQQIKQNLEASTATLGEMWDDEWTKLIDVLMKMCLESDEAVFVVELLPIFMKYSDFIDVFCDRMVTVSGEFALPSGKDEGPRVEQVPSFLGSLLCARWPRGLHRDTQESNPILFTAFEIIRGWLLVVNEATERGEEERREKASVDEVAKALQAGCKIEEDAAGDSAPAAEKDEEEREEEEEDDEDEDDAPLATTPALLNRCCSALAALCESQQRSLWLARPELVDDMYKCIKTAITHNREIEGSVKSALLHTYLLMNEWTRSKAVTTKSATTQTAAT
ncbi:hypothetical protein PMAYCL1PPCAC_14356 [Pristionchus mayeri]|uniref:DUF7627 domain-containing protein n=1 Tax=Pristionchus mayeri TaxID=1317129 RepID=A0AAN4ZNV4_9BILA|nr:hypothetical protein PMAYCL1PPCAC_14356 [Pristionchus mayeri]